MGKQRITARPQHKKRTPARAKQSNARASVAHAKAATGTTNGQMSGAAQVRAGLGQEHSVELAKALTAGKITFSRWADCNSQLPLNVNPVCVSFSQLFLFPEAAKHQVIGSNVRFLTYPRVLGPDRTRDDKTEGLIVDVAFKSLVPSTIPIDAEIEAGSIPDPAERGGVAAKVATLASKGLVSRQVKLPLAQLDKTYKDFVRVRREEQRREAIVSGLKNKPFRMPIQELMTLSKADVRDRLKAELFLGHFQAMASPQAKVALLAQYRQCWEPVGYTRGDMVNSFSLAPGEQLTLEYHYWDKSTIKSEEELASESESKITNTLTQRESRELLGEVFSELGTKVDGGVNATIPIPVGEVPIPVGADFGAEVAGNVGTKVQSAAKSAADRVVEASNTFKQSHRVRVEITRETGSENKQTRVIANTNRCHTLNCTYFEVMANYLVSVRLVGIVPCLLVPMESPAITRDWVLCHEHILKKVLLDRLFLAGFAAAKLLKARVIAKALKDKECKQDKSAISPGAGSPGVVGSNAPSETNDPRLAGFVSDIVRDFDEVKKDAENVFADFEDIDGFDAALDFLGKVGTRLRRLLFWAVLNLNATAVRALEKLKEAQSSGAPSLTALNDFFGLVTSRDYESNVVESTIKEGLDSMGLPRALVDALFIAHDFNLVSLADDDAGLAASVRRAEVGIGANAGPFAIPAVPPPIPGGGATPIPGVAPVAPNTESCNVEDRANAQVEFDRLICHLKGNRWHYVSAVFQSLHPDQRLELLRRRGLSGVVDNEIAGFLNNLVAFPLATPTDFLDLLKVSAGTKVQSKALEKLLADSIQKINAEQPRLVTIPTPATVMEATLGQCDACETFIRDSRAIELRTQAAKAGQEEARARNEAAEADRREHRIAASPPDLTDPVDRSLGWLVVELNSNP